MIKNYNIIASFIEDNLEYPKMVFVKDDNISTQLSFYIKDTVTDGQNIKLTFKNSNNDIYEQLLTIINSKATYLVPNEFLNYSGYASLSLTYISGEEIYTISEFITNILIENNLGVGVIPTPEEISIINDIISQLNEEIAIVQSMTGQIPGGTTGQSLVKKTNDDFDMEWKTLNADMITDGTTNKVYTAVEKTRLANTSGSNTGDQDLSVKIDLNGVNSNIDKLKFNVSNTQTLVNPGELRWNNTDKTLDLKLSTDVTMQLGQEILLRATNKETFTILNGKAVYVSGATGSNPSIKLASASLHDIAKCTIGIATEDLTANENGFICTQGVVNGINTYAFEEGQEIFLGENGSITNVLPVSPLTKVCLGVVLRKHSSNGAIFVKIQIYNDLTELSDVHTTDLINNDILVWNSTNSRFENRQNSMISGYITPVTGYKSVDGSIGATGSFQSQDGKTISVKNGIIVGIT